MLYKDHFSHPSLQYYVSLYSWTYMYHFYPINLHYQKKCFASYSVFMYFHTPTSSPAPFTDSLPRPIYINLQPVFVSDQNCSVLRCGQCLPVCWLWKVTES